MTTNHSWHQPKRLVAAMVTVTMMLQTMSSAYGAVLQVPGTYTAPPSPNVMFTLDDSGSMMSDAIPDFLAPTNLTGMLTDANSNALGQSNATFPGMWKANSGYLSTTYYRSTNAIARYLRSSAGNPLYYDPKVTYTPWPTPADDKVAYGNADPTRVNIHDSDPFNTGRRLNIVTRINESGSASDVDDQTRNYYRATYYVYTGSTPMPAATPNNPLNTAGNFTKVEIKPSVLTYARAASRSDCTGAVGPTGCSYTQELQNFANWLQYYRSRMLMAKGGVASAFSQQGTGLRVGFTTINNGANMRRGVATFSGTSRSGFYSDLYGRPTNGSTPLRLAMDQVGRYFLGTAGNNPWAEDTTSSPRRLADSCRKSFHIMSTDGFWNGSDAAPPANNNNDTFSTAEVTPAQPAPGGATFRYSDSNPAGTLSARFSVSPFRDNNTANVNTLADVAAYYWKTDLQADSVLENRLSPTTRDPAYWQHLTTFTVGLGISGSGQVRPADAAMSTQDANGQYVVSTATVSSSPFYAYRGKAWLSDPALRDLLISQRIPLQWSRAVADGRTTGDDLIHAAMNGRGRYFSATNPTELAAGLGQALAEATNSDSSYASLALASTNETSTSNRLYQARYNPYGWTGRLYSFPLSGATSTTNTANALWEVSAAMPAPANRNIFTWNPLATVPTGSPFTWAGLNATQQAALGPTSGVGSSATERQAVLDYLRGSSAQEAQNGGPLRDRVRDTATGGVLGDIVGGSPVRGPTAGGGYHRLSTLNASTATAQTTYSLFRGNDTSASNSPLATMVRTLFFAANDGMLHAVNAADDPADYAYVPGTVGRERFAFVPNSVFSVPRTPYNGTTSTVKKLYELSRPDYAHLFTVNGPPQIADAYINPHVGNSTGWKSVLLGSTGAGARSIFALDVTNPEVGTGSNNFNTSKILWEFSEEQNADMGYVPGYPNVGLMADGTWVAIIGNGHDSANGQAKLFLIDLATGAVIWQQAVGTAGGNGLSQPNFTLNENREVQAIWAGDLRGNMWKFDVSSPLRSNWHVAYGGTPLFTTPNAQPITVMPEIQQRPDSTTAMIMFGTGKLFDTQDTATDNTNPNRAQTQMIFGIWDDGITRTTGLGQLVPQTISAATNGFARVSENPIDWSTKRGWYIPLTTGTGERVTVNPVIALKGAAVPLFVIANTPSGDPCASGGTSRVFALDPISGATPRFSVFDTNRDGVINSADNRQNVYYVGGGILSSPRFLSPLYSGGVAVEAPGTRGRTGAQEGGVEINRRISGNSGTDCAAASGGRMVAGISDNTAINERVKFGECKPRVSWRQIQ